jgi:hypothetical protein
VFGDEFLVMYFNHFQIWVSLTMSIFRKFINSHTIKIPLYSAMKGLTNFKETSSVHICAWAMHEQLSKKNVTVDPLTSHSSVPTSTYTTHMHAHPPTYKKVIIIIYIRIHKKYLRKCNTIFTYSSWGMTLFFRLIKLCRTKNHSGWSWSAETTAWKKFFRGTTFTRYMTPGSILCT